MSFFPQLETRQKTTLLIHMLISEGVSDIKPKLNLLVIFN